MSCWHQAAILFFRFTSHELLLPRQTLCRAYVGHFIFLNHTCAQIIKTMCWLQGARNVKASERLLLKFQTGFPFRGRHFLWSRFLTSGCSFQGMHHKSLTFEEHPLESRHVCYRRWNPPPQGTKKGVDLIIRCSNSWTGNRKTQFCKRR